MVHEKWSLWWCQDSNPQPFGHEFFALTTRPRRLAKYCLFLPTLLSPVNYYTIMRQDDSSYQSFAVLETNTEISFDQKDSSKMDHHDE